MSYELRVTSLDIWLKSSVLWVTNSNPQVTIQIHTGCEFKSKSYEEEFKARVRGLKSRVEAIKPRIR